MDGSMEGALQEWWLHEGGRYCLQGDSYLGLLLCVNSCCLKALKALQLYTINSAPAPTTSLLSMCTFLPLSRQPTNSALIVECAINQIPQSHIRLYIFEPHPLSLNPVQYPTNTNPSGTTTCRSQAFPTFSSFIIPEGKDSRQTASKPHSAVL